jgi:NAD(P)-dependent dehydrogenase (short-subunit alcohol dehydrogenase family)
MLVLTLSPSGIGLETSILFAKEGANIMLADISAPALETAKAKVLELVPNASRVETMVRTPSSTRFSPSSPQLTPATR